MTATFEVRRRYTTPRDAAADEFRFHRNRMVDLMTKHGRTLVSGYLPNGARATATCLLVAKFVSDHQAAAIGFASCLNGEG